MRSNPFARSATRFALGLSVLVALALSGCGILGNKKKASDSLPGTDLGCLDTLSGRVKQYSDGEITEAEWGSTFDCVSDQITKFENRVRGAGPDGSYSAEDIRGFTQDFLVKTHTITPQFATSLFEFKSAIFGGSVEYITVADLDNISGLFKFLKTETTALLPLVRAQAKTPSTAASLALASGMDQVGKDWGVYLQRGIGAHSISKESFLPFAKEVLNLTNGNVALVDKYEELIRNAKVLVFGGDKNLIEAATWPQLVRELCAAYGIYNAYSRVDGHSAVGEIADYTFADDAEKDAYLLEVVRRARYLLEDIVVLNKGSIPLSRVNAVIESLPLDVIEMGKRRALEGDLPNVISHVFFSRVPRSIDTVALKTAFDLFETGFTGQIWVKRIYRNLGADTTAAEFVAAARGALASLPAAVTLPAGARPPVVTDRAAIQGLIDVATTFKGLFQAEGPHILFSFENEGIRTRNHMILMQWFQKAMGHIFKSYATGPDGLAQVSDLVDLSSDFGNTLKAFGKFSPDVTYEAVAAKRFREGNLFMPNSNGDLYLDQLEGTYYLAFLYSAGSTTSQVWETITQQRKLCAPNFIDELGHPAVDAVCFREAFYKNLDVFWAGLPGLRDAYNELPADEKTTFIENMEIAGRKSGYTDLPIGEFDVDSISTIPHYIESLMHTHDLNHDGTIDLDELLDHAFPIFREALKAIPGVPSGDYFLKVALTYVIAHGRIPSNAEFIGWAIAGKVPGLFGKPDKPKWRREVITDRAALVQVLAVLTQSAG